MAVQAVRTTTRQPGVTVYFTAQGYQIRGVNLKGEAINKQIDLATAKGYFASLTDVKHSTHQGVAQNVGVQRQGKWVPATFRNAEGSVEGKRGGLRMVFPSHSYIGIMLGEEKRVIQAADNDLDAMPENTPAEVPEEEELPV